MPAPVTFTITGRYLETGVIPPRCRKPRDVYRDAEAEVTIDHVEADQAPLVFRFFDGNIARGKMHQVREYNDRLYQQTLTSEDEPVTIEDFLEDPEQFGRFYGRSHALDEFQTSVRNVYDDMRFIGGTLWEAVGEPRYVVTGNRPTYLYVGVHTYTATHLGTDRVFRADEREAALEYVRDQAVRHGRRDPISEESVLMGEIEVLDPEAVTLVLNDPGTLAEQETRGEYHDLLREAYALRDASSGEEVKRADEVMAALGRVIGHMAVSKVPAATPKIPPYEGRRRRAGA